MKKLLVAMTATLSLFGVACGNDDDADTTETTVAEAPAETEAPVDTEAPVETEAPAETAAPETAAAETVPSDTAATETVAPDTAATETTAVGDAAAAPTDGANAYTLKEWSLEGPATLAAGTVNLTVANGGEFAHEFLILKGAYADLPKNDLGTVQEDQLAADAKVGEIERFDAGTTQSASFDLAPGTYTFLCNIEFGPNSHAGKGQRLDVTVA